MSVMFQSLREAGYREPDPCVRCGFIPDHGGDGLPDGPPVPRVCPRCGLETPPPPTAGESAQT